MTIYGYSDRLHRVEGSRDISLMSPEDIADVGLTAGQTVTLVTDVDHGVLMPITTKRNVEDSCFLIDAGAGRKRLLNLLQ